MNYSNSLRKKHIKSSDGKVTVRLMIFPRVFLMCFHRIYPTLKLMIFLALTASRSSISAADWIMVFWPDPSFAGSSRLWLFKKNSQNLCKELLCAFTHSWPVALYALRVPADAPVVVRSQAIPPLPFAYESCFHQTKRKVIFTPSYTFFPADRLCNSVSWSCRPRYFSQKFIRLAGARWSTPI